MYREGYRAPVYFEGGGAFLLPGFGIMSKIAVGGQAVIEGVMMRAPNAMAIAVRKPNGEVVVKEDVWRSLSNRFKFLKLPLIRGSVVLIETLINGLQALSFSANQALEEGKGEDKLSSWAIGSIMALAFGIGILFFVVLPHYLTGFLGDFLGHELAVENVLFHLVDVLIKEGVSVARANEFRLGSNYYPYCIDYIRNAGHHKPSMLQDIEAGRRTEVDYINGKIVEYGAQAGVPTPYNTMIRGLVKALEPK